MMAKFTIGIIVLVVLTGIGSISEASEVSWSMVIIPDTQGYNTTTGAVFNEMTQWIADSKEARNIAVVLHEGDITNDNTDTQWAVAATAMSTLNGRVPYVLTTGNHDYWNGPLKLNEYFALGDNPLNSSPDGIMTTERITDDLENVYATFTAPDGRDMLLFGLEFIPTRRPEVIAWANEIAALPQYADYTAVLVTHANLKEGPATPDGEPTAQREPAATPNYLWDRFVSKHANMELVLNGHALDGDDSNPNGKLTTARQSSTGINGNTVHEIVFNAQQQPNGGNGYLRLMEFLDDGLTVQVRTYSPYLDQWLTNNRNEFQISLSAAFPGDYNHNGVVDAADYVVWRDAMGGTYLANDPTPGTVDESDFLYWRNHFGETLGSGAGSAVAVPEPSTFLLLCIGACLILCAFRHTPR